jgi:hypothetical protein
MLEGSVLGHAAKRLGEWSKDHTSHQLHMVESERRGYDRWVYRVQYRAQCRVLYREEGV